MRLDNIYCDPMYVPHFRPVEATKVWPNTSTGDYPAVSWDRAWSWNMAQPVYEVQLGAQWGYGGIDGKVDDV